MYAPLSEYMIPRTKHDERLLDIERLEEMMGRRSRVLGGSIGIALSA